jgi:hypothetical protein
VRRAVESYRLGHNSILAFQLSAFSNPVRSLLVPLFFAFTAASGTAAELTARDVVAQLYQAHRSKHDPLNETPLLGRYFDAALLKFYLRDQRQANGEVGRLDGDPLYNAQDFKITDFTISPPETAGGETRVTVRFKNFGKPICVDYLLTRTGDGWKISDIRYDDGSSLRKILQSD